MTPAVKVEIYASAYCSYCRWARALLERKQVEYTFHDVDREPALRQEMIRRSRHSSVPQIFIAGQAIGGFDELSALDRSGRLDQLLSSTPNV